MLKDESTAFVVALFSCLFVVLFCLEFPTTWAAIHRLRRN